VKRRLPREHDADGLPVWIGRCVCEDWLSDEEMNEEDPSFDGLLASVRAWRRWRDARDIYEKESGVLLPEPSSLSPRWRRA
jgi:hypothetical protein